MSKTCRLQTRVSEHVAERLDERTDNRSKWLRELVLRELDELDDSDDGASRVPPEEEDLRVAWETLKQVSSESGVVREQAALPVVAQRLQQPQAVVRYSALQELQRRGYAQRITDQFGRQAAWKVFQ